MYWLSLMALLLLTTQTSVCSLPSLAAKIQPYAGKSIPWPLNSTKTNTASIILVVQGIQKLYNGCYVMNVTLTFSPYNTIGPYQAIRIVADRNFREFNSIFFLKFM